MWYTGCIIYSAEIAVIKRTWCWPTSTLANVECFGCLETKSFQVSLLRSIVYVCLPMGSNYLALPFFSRIDKVLEAQDRLPDLDNPQIALHLIRSCLSLSNINHLLGTVPPGSADSQLG